MSAQIPLRTHEKAIEPMVCTNTDKYSERLLSCLMCLLRCLKHRNT